MFGTHYLASVSTKVAATAIATAAAVALLLPASAQTSDTFDVTANVVTGCIITANDLDFGNYSAVAALPTDATSTIQVDCSLGAIFEVALDTGSNGGDYTGRLMTNGVDNLTYNLYLDPLYLTVWGDDTGATEDVTGVSLGAPINYTVYGRVTAGQDVSTGAYTDTVTATIAF